MVLGCSAHSPACTTLARKGFKKFFFTYFEREREQGSRERGRERILSRLRAVNAELDTRLKLMNAEIMT